jgi:hypothetical protein
MVIQELDESRPPATAEEYLRRVMKEAKRVEDVGVGNLTQFFYLRNL